MSLGVSPSAKSIQGFKAKIREMTASNRGYDAPDKKMAAINAVTRGWIYYYRYVNTKTIAYKLDFWVNGRFVKWARRRHAKRVRAVLKLYKARQVENSRNRWNLRAMNDHGKPLWLFRMSDVPIGRYWSRAASAWQNPYLTTSTEVPTAEGDTPLEEETWIGNSLASEQRNWAIEAKARARYRCELCNRSLLKGEIEQLHTHHRVPKRKGGQNHPNNARVLCQQCHVQVHKSQTGKANVRAV